MNEVVAMKGPAPSVSELAETRNQPVIECTDLWKIFGDIPADAVEALRDRRLTRADAMDRYGCVVGLAGVSLRVDRGDVCCVMGLSGSGKSTLVRHINGLIKPTAGSVRVDGVEIGAVDAATLRRIRSQKIGMVFQNFGLLPHRTVLDNVAFGLELRGATQSERYQRARDTLKLVNLEAWELSYPHQLSGGMQQRVGLARALACDPQVLLLDEPFGALDPLIRRQLQDQFIELSRTIGKTAVFITHDLEEALRIGTRILVMKDGAVVQEGTPSEILLSPATEYVAQFVSGIPKARFLRAGDLISDQRAEEPTDTCQQIEASASLTEAGRLAYQSTQPIRIIGPDGRSLGMLDRDRLLAAILEDTHEH